MEQARQTGFYGEILLRWFVRLVDGRGIYTWAQTALGAQVKAENTRGCKVKVVRPAGDPISDRLRAPVARLGPPAGPRPRAAP